MFISATFSKPAKDVEEKLGKPTLKYASGKIRHLQPAEQTHTFRKVLQTNSHSQKIFQRSRRNNS